MSDETIDCQLKTYKNIKIGGTRIKHHVKKSSILNNPLISIITVVRNGENTLEQTIQSIINQSYDNIEYIIVDGNSTDKTLDIIHKYEDKIDYWVSESDQGIYDAMNKGIQASTGELIGLLNSGDLYTNNAIEKVINLYKHNRGVHENIIITGAMYRYSENGILFRLVKTQENLDKRINKGMPINHPATFVSKKTYESIGYFDSHFKICGDYDFIFRAYHSSSVKFIFTDFDIAYMMLDGVSEKFNSLLTRSIEHFFIRRKNIFWLKNYFISITWLSYVFTKFILKRVFGNKLMAIYYKLKFEYTKT
jgi:glycosyltransferase involved in cell wall biosynthesis